MSLSTDMFGTPLLTGQTALWRGDHILVAVEIDTVEPDADGKLEVVRRSTGERIKVPVSRIHVVAQPLKS